MVPRIYCSAILLTTAFVQISRCVHEGLMKSNLDLVNFPLPGPGSRVRRQADSNDNNTYYFPQPIYDDRRYYRTEHLTGVVSSHWIEIGDDAKHQNLSQSPGGYSEVNATFEFQFYGHTIKRIYLSTAGILSMSSFAEDRIPTHYICPYLGHFNPSLYMESSIFFESRDDMFVVEYRNVRLREAADLGPFTLETIVYSNGTIKFLYKKLPRIQKFLNNATLAQDLIVGLVGSVNLQIAGINIAAYYHAEFINPQKLYGGDVVIFHPLPTCSEAKNCHTCVSRNLKFDCSWCGKTKTCYDSLDQYTEEFVASGCASEITSNCTGYRKTVETTVPATASSSSSVTTILIVVIVLAVIGLLGGLFFYAYRHPESSAGRWLIEHRPSLWKGLIFGRKDEMKAGQDQIQY